jgi:hypothetical protein
LHFVYYSQTHSLVNLARALSFILSAILSKFNFLD